MKVFETNGKISIDFIKLLYKKLKVDLFYDKTQKLTRDKLVNNISESDKYFIKVRNLFQNILDDNDAIVNEYLNEINVSFIPKKSHKIESAKSVLCNIPDKDLEFEFQLFIDMPIELHLIGIAWILLCGFRLDLKLDNNIFGNRISDIFYSNKTKNIYDMDFTNSHFLFQPYFQKYESWQICAYNAAKELLEKKTSCIITTFDIKRFYYNVKLSDSFINKVFKECNPNNDSFIHKLTRIVFRIISNYGMKANKYSTMIGEKDLSASLPIGFYPSSIISNYYLHIYDKYIFEEVKPVYYGRYVDDIIIVDKINLEGKASTLDERFKDDILDKYLLFKNEENKINNNLYKDDANYTLNVTNNYSIRQVINKDKTSINIFDSNYRYDSIDEIIKYFENNEVKFNYLNDEEIDYVNNFLDIYSFSKEITKFNQLCDYEVDRFKLSVSLAQYKKYLCLIGYDKNQISNLNELFKVLNNLVILENFTNLEKLFDIFMLSSKLDTTYMFQFIDLVKDSIDSFRIYKVKSISIVEDVKKSLKNFAVSAFVSSSINFGGKIVSKIIDYFQKEFGIEQLNVRREKYRELNMYDKVQCSFYFPLIKNPFEYLKTLEETQDYFSLSDYRLCQNIICIDMPIKYNDFIPVYVKPHELGLIKHLESLLMGRDVNYDYHLFSDDSHYDTAIYKRYEEIYRLLFGTNVILNNYDNYFEIRELNKKTKSNIKIAISNIQKYFDLNDFCHFKFDRSIDRLNNLSKIVNNAINEKVDYLVMPEACIPIEWLLYFANILIKNNIALISGIEPIIINNKVYNFMVNILPFKANNYSYAYYIYHLKKYYSPIEINEYTAKGLNYVAGVRNELINYNNFYYKMHLCYEMAILSERSLFFDNIDACFAVEFNGDIHYFSSIVDSLTRDMHCYVIQVNESSHGDCRITAPKKYECKDLIKVKGGTNPTILVDSIDIYKLRKFQLNTILQQYQIKDKEFKLTPTNFNQNNVLKRINNMNPLK